MAYTRSVLLLSVLLYAVSYGYVVHSANEREKDVLTELNTERILDLLVELKNLKRKANSENGINGAESDVEYDIEQWLDKNDVILGQKQNEDSIASWHYITNLTDLNAQKSSEVSVAVSKWEAARVDEAKKFLDSTGSLRNKTALRMLNSWVYGQGVPAPKDKTLLDKMSKVETDLTTIYGNAVLHKNGKVYQLEPELTEIMAQSTDYDKLLWAWKGWRDATGPLMRPKFTKAVKYMNIAATDNGYTDVGESWRVANYEYDNIEPMVDKLFEEIKPLYEQLHAYVRRKLSKKYSVEKVPLDKPIPAHLLGNMWAQEWDNIYNIVVPYPDIPSTDVTDTMVEQGYTPNKMFELAEKFFLSIGLEPMTETFWKKSMIVRPDDRPVQCHPSAEDFMTTDDFRIKMCTEVNMDYLQTIHHEMGHIEYFMQYRNQSNVFRGGANAAFHEAIGDTIALSVVTPAHLTAIGLLDEEEEEEEEQDEGLSVAEKRNINFQMAVALKKIAFLPFGYMIDKWRWEVFRGNIDDTNYNAKWWEYRTMYQGVAAPIERSEHDFDPGAKYHVAAFVPYIRYFLSFLGQFQFQDALCDAAGHEGPLHECDIYRSTDAGDLLKSALHLGSSQPWPDVMEILTGQREFKSSAIYKYFQPLYSWLKTQNSESDLGW